MIAKTTQTHAPTFEELAHYEPRLLDVLRLARSYHSANKSRRNVSFDHLWYRDLKPRLSELVGWYRVDKTQHPIDLTSSAAYCVAYDRLYDTLHGRSR